MRACAACLRRTQLVAELSPAMERRFSGNRPGGVLAMDDEQLVVTLLGREAAEARRPVALSRSTDELLTQAANHERLLGVTAICRHGVAYPDRLFDLYDPPAVLHVLGGVERLPEAFVDGAQRPSVAIVGARRASEESRTVARRFAEAAAASGIVVVSGMAFGIDAAAHDGALAGLTVGRGAGAAFPAPTVAVLAGGIERPSPARLRPLYERIAVHGAVVGELPPGTTPRRWGFPARNRLIAALVDAVVVVAATKKSGSLITAGFAYDLDRPLGAVPGSVTAAGSEGSNALLRRDGVRPVLEPQDIVDLLPDDLRAAIGGQAATIDPLSGLEGGARAIAARLVSGPCTIEQLLEEQDPSEVLEGLGDLEASGRLQRTLTGHLSLLPEPPFGGR